MDDITKSATKSAINTWPDGRIGIVSEIRNEAIINMVQGAFRSRLKHSRKFENSGGGAYPTRLCG